MEDQAVKADFPLEIVAYSEPKSGQMSEWMDSVRQRLTNVDYLLVICGDMTDVAAGVAAELDVAREMEIPYRLLWGRQGRLVAPPSTADRGDKIHEWHLNNLESLVSA